MNAAATTRNDARRTTSARLAWSAAGFTGLTLLLAACGSGGTTGGSAYGAAPSTSTAKATPAAAVDLQTSEHGKVLVDGQGRTLYLFEADQGGKPTCTGACTGLWPPYLSAGAPQVGAGVVAKLVGSTAGSGGSQVTYAGHPLYYFPGDAAPGDTAGQGLDDFGAKW